MRVECSGSIGLAIATAALAVAGAGCSTERIGSDGGTGGSPGSDGGNVPLTMFAADFAISYCAPRVACGAFVDLATCRAATFFEQNQVILTAIGEVGRGTVVYDPAAAAACITGLPQDCAVTQGNQAQVLSVNDALNLFQQIPACAGVFTGTLPSGAVCELFTFACAGASYCNPGNYNCTMPNGCCMGNCQPNVAPTPHKEGESCTDNDLCRTPAVCDNPGNGTCVLPPAEGFACDASVNFPCASLGDYCRVDGSTGTTGTCVPRLLAESACTVSPPVGFASDGIDPCQLDAHCAGDGTGNGIPTCVPYAGLGSPCDQKASVCDPLLICANGVCAQNPAGIDCGD